MASPSSLPSFSKPPPQLSAVNITPIHGSCWIDGTQEGVLYTIEINPNFFYSSHAEINFNREMHPCSLKLNFPILDKKKLLSKLKQSEEKRTRTFTIRVIPPSGDQKKYILKIFSEKFEEATAEYKKYLAESDLTKNSERIELAAATCRTGDEEQKREIMGFLLSVLKESNDPNKQPNAASYNALHILSYNNYPFIKQDLRNLQIPKAQLIGTLLYMCDLSNSNLKDVKMEKVSLSGCKMRGCIMEGVEVDRRPSLNHPEKVTKLSPTEDGHFLATCTEDGGVRIWNLLNYQCLFDFSTVPSAIGLAKITDVLFFGKSGPLITSHTDNTLSLWKITSTEGELKLSLDSNISFNHPFQKFIHAPTGKHFGILCKSNHFHLFQICLEGLQKQLTIPETQDGRKNFCLSANAKFIAFTTSNKLTVIHATPQEKVKTEWLLNGEILRLEFSLNSKYLIGLISSNGITAIGMWVLEHKEVDLIVEEGGKITDFQLIQDHSDKQKDKKTLCVYAQESMIFGKKIATKKNHFSMSFLPQKNVQFRTIPVQNLLVSISEGSKAVDVWSIPQSHSSNNGHSSAVFSSSPRKAKLNFKLPKLHHHLKNYNKRLDQLPYQITPNGTHLLIYFSQDKEDKTFFFYFCIWDQIQDQLYYEFIGGDNDHNRLSKKSLSKSFRKKFKSNKKPPLLAINDALLLGIAIGRKCVIWDVSTKKTLLKQNCKSQITKILFKKIRDRDALFICEANGTIKLIDISSKNSTAFKGHAQHITDLAVCNKETYLASTSDDRTLRVWSLHNGTELYKAEIHARMSNPQFLENHSFLKTYDEFDGAEYIWTIEDNQLKIQSLTPNRFYCTGTDFEGVTGLSNINKRLFRQLGGEHIPCDEN